MKAIIKRELSNYFSSPLGSGVLVIFYLFSGLFFNSYNLVAQNTSMSSLFSSIVNLLGFLVPVLTMRLMSEEKKQRTDQLLLTSPVSLPGLVLGKLLSCYIVYVLMCSITLVYAVIMSSFGSPDWPVVISQFVGLLLLGLALTAIGMFISSLTESQIIAVVGTYAIILLVTIISSIAQIVPNATVAAILNAIALFQRYNSFSYGLLDFSNIVYFLSVAAFFVYLTIRVFEKKRWS